MVFRNGAFLFTAATWRVMAMQSYFSLIERGKNFGVWGEEIRIVDPDFVVSPRGSEKKNLDFSSFIEFTNIYK